MVTLLYHEIEEQLPIALPELRPAAENYWIAAPDVPQSRAAGELIVSCGASPPTHRRTRWIMVTLLYHEIEEQLPIALPELRPAAENYWNEEGRPGEDSGPYIFFGMFARYIEVLLAMRSGSARDRLLARTFGFSERMLLSPDSDVRDLAYIELYENQGPWWFGRARQFFGPAARAQLDQHEPHWNDGAHVNCEADLERDIIDLYGVRDDILNELQSEGCGVMDIPGITAPRSAG